MTTMSRVRHRYGHESNQVGDMWLPDRVSPSGAPVVVLIHGGWWRSVYTRSLMDRLARATVLRGWAAWNIEYRRIGRFGGGGGWPATFFDVGKAIDYVDGSRRRRPVSRCDVRTLGRRPPRPLGRCSWPRATRSAW